MNLEDENFLSARAKFVQKLKNNGGESCTCVAFYNEEEGFIDDGNPQCHIGLSYYQEVNPLVIFSGFQRNHKSHKDKKQIGQAFFNYLVKHPVWGKSILNETFEDVYENGWMFSTNQNNNNLCSAVFATRWPTEFPASCKAFATYVEHGMQSDIAFLLSTISAEDLDDGNIYFMYNSGHMPCAAGVPDTFVKNFLSYKTYEKDDKNIYKDIPKYSGIDRVFLHKHYDDSTVYNTKLYLRVKSILSGDVFTPTKDIFLTKDFWEKKRGDKDQSWVINIQKDLAKVVEEMNVFREEILKDE